MNEIPVTPETAAVSTADPATTASASENTVIENTVVENAVIEGETDYLQLWAASLEEVLTQVSGAPCGVDFSLDAPSGPPIAESGDIYFLITLTGAVRGEMGVRVPRTVGLVLVQLMLREAQPAAEWTSEHHEALEELFRQVGGRAAPAIRSTWGEVQLRVESGPPPTWAVAATAWTCSSSDTPVTFRMEWQLSAALSAELKTAEARRNALSTAAVDLHLENAPVTTTGVAEARVTGARMSEAPAPQAAEADLAAKLELFKDVELDVTLRFGGRRMLLREILDLGPGAVVELDRQLQDPVDLLLDGKIIARGEVVVVEGNYGLRVVDVVAPPR
ncbi:MAG TPA: FliM/FliN family flagellar motor switch protein [Terriglobales bacterium]|jgi:flagellar motor switch protein FliN/FliY